MLDILIPIPEHSYGDEAKYFYRNLSNLKQDILRRIGKEAYIGVCIYKDPELERDVPSPEVRELVKFVIDSGYEESHRYFNGMIFIILSYIYIEKYGVNEFIEASITDILELNIKYNFSFFIYNSMTFYNEDDNHIMNILYNISTSLYKEKKIKRNINVTNIHYMSIIRNIIDENIASKEIIHNINRFKEALLEKPKNPSHSDRRPRRAELLINLFELILNILDVNVEVVITSTTSATSNINNITDTYNIKVYESYSYFEAIKKVLKENEYKKI